MILEKLFVTVVGGKTVDFNSFLLDNTIVMFSFYVTMFKFSLRFL